MSTVYRRRFYLRQCPHQRLADHARQAEERDEQGCLLGGVAEIGSVGREVRCGDEVCEALQNHRQGK